MALGELGRWFARMSGREDEKSCHIDIASFVVALVIVVRDSLLQTRLVIAGGYCSAREETVVFGEECRASCQYFVKASSCLWIGTGKQLSPP